MAQIGVMSYNMSFASDQGLPIGSEKHFIKQGGNWDNALGLVKEFLTTASSEYTPAVAGLQEINDADFLISKVKGMNEFQGGTTKLAAFVGSSITKHELTAGGTIDAATGELVNDGLQYCGYAAGESRQLAFWGPAYLMPFAQRPMLAIIWDTKLLGEKVSDYGADLGTDPIFTAAGKKQLGRPIYIVKTDKNYLLVNLHGPNYADESLKGMPVLRQSLEFHIKKAAKALDATLDKVLIMGDFNDPHFGINDSAPILNFMNGRTADQKSQVLSCCYNFNSSCPIGIYNASANTIGPMPVSDLPEDVKTAVLAAGGYTETSIVKALPYECFINVTPKGEDGKFPQENEELGNPYAREMTPQGRGNLDNYKFTGDYVMSNLPVVKPLSLYRNAAVSKESDHEPVYAVFEASSAGGRRQTRRNQRQRQSQRQNQRQRQQQRQRQSQRQNQRQNQRQSQRQNQRQSQRQRQSRR